MCTPFLSVRLVTLLVPSPGVWSSPAYSQQQPIHLVDSFRRLDRTQRTHTTVHLNAHYIQRTHYPCHHRSITQQYPLPSAPPCASSWRAAPTVQLVVPVSSRGSTEGGSPGSEMRRRQRGEIPENPTERKGINARKLPEKYKKKEPVTPFNQFLEGYPLGCCPGCLQHPTPNTQHPPHHTTPHCA